MSREAIFRYKELRRMLEEQENTLKEHLELVNTIEAGYVNDDKENPIFEAFKGVRDAVEKSREIAKKIRIKIGNKNKTIYADQTEKAYDFMQLVGKLTEQDAIITELISAIHLMVAREVGDDTDKLTAETMFETAAKYRKDAEFKGDDDE